MPLLRGMARTAVVAGTATAVSNKVSRRQQERWQREESQAPTEPQGAGAMPASEADPVTRLKELGALRDQGILTDDEFEAQKAKVLASMG